VDLVCDLVDLVCDLVDLVCDLVYFDEVIHKFATLKVMQWTFGFSRDSH